MKANGSMTIGIFPVSMLLLPGFETVELGGLLLGLLSPAPRPTSISLFTVNSSIVVTHPSITGLVSPELNKTLYGTCHSLRVANIPQPK